MLSSAQFGETSPFGLNEPIDDDENVWNKTNEPKRKILFYWTRTVYTRKEMFKYDEGKHFWCLLCGVGIRYLSVSAKTSARRAKEIRRFFRFSHQFGEGEGNHFQSLNLTFAGVATISRAIIVAHRSAQLVMLCYVGRTKMKSKNAAMI